LQEDILDRWPDIDRILIHYEPEQKESILVAVPVEVLSAAQSELDAPLSEHFGEAPAFALLRKEMRSGKITLETLVANHFRGLERHRGVKVAEFLVELGVDEVWTRVELEGKGAGYALEALGIDALTVPATTLRELVTEIGEAADAPEITADQPSP